MNHVLVVDDNENNRYLLDAMLSAAGYTVSCAVNGITALELAALSKPDVIVSDILMPGMDGFALCKEWRSRSDFADIPFIFYTATYTDLKDEEFALSLGADVFLIKPQEPELFLNRIKSLLDDHRRGALPRQKPTAIPEQVYLKEYNQSLVRKLEDKLFQLEQVNKQLHAELYARQSAEQQVRKLNAELEYRVLSRTEQLAAANRELESFSHSVSHDLRTPLRHISGYVRILMEDRESVFSPSARDCLNVIQRATERMDLLIGGLLKLAQNDTRSLQIQPLLTESLVNHVRRDLSSTLVNRNVQWKIHDLPDVVADETLFRQVWANLLDNALKYSRHRDVAEVEIGGKLDAESREVEFFVRDNGVGFKMEYATQLFAPFQRLHPDSEFEGLGIGLANVRRILERHEGKIWVDSKPGEGTTFFFRLPAQKGSGGEVQAQE